MKSGDLDCSKDRSPYWGLKFLLLKTKIIIELEFFLILFFMLMGSSYSLAVNQKKTSLVNPSDHLKQILLNDFNLIVIDENGFLTIKKSKIKNRIPSSLIIKLINSGSGIKGIEFQGLEIFEELDFRSLSKKGSSDSDSLVEKSLKFINCIFTDKIIAKYYKKTNENANNEAVIFTKPLKVFNCEFMEEVIFDQAYFDDDMMIGDSFFHKKVVFFFCEFCGHHNSFRNNKFNGELIFSLSIFKSRTDFINIECKDSSFFKRITAHQEIDFSGSSFVGEVDFGTSNFYNRVGFEDVDFSRSFFFIKVNEKVDQSRQWVKMNFKGANFRDNAYFRESFLTNVMFSPSENQPIIFLGDADFRNAKFRNADFTEASFNMVDFSDSVFKKVLGGEGYGLILKQCSYKNMIVTWEQISHAHVDEGDYKKLKENFEEMKNFDDACNVLYLMKTLERKRLEFSFALIWNSISWFFGYFVRPTKVLIESTIIIFLWALLYAGIKLRTFDFEFSSTKKERKITLTRVPIESNSKHKSKVTSKKDPKAESKPPRKGREQKVLCYLKNLPLAFFFSLTLFSKLHFKSDYIPKNTTKWIKTMAYIEWYLGYLFWSVFFYSLSRRSSILHDILSGLPIF